MSLNWSVKEVKFDKLWVKGKEDGMGNVSYNPDDSDGDYLNPVVNALIWASMSIGMSEITKANWKKFAARLAVAEKVYGKFVKFGPAAKPVEWFGVDLKDGIPPSFVEACIGLKTNVSMESDASFLKRMGKSLMENAVRSVG